MEIKATKSGGFAHPDPSKAHVRLVAGQIGEYDPALAQSIIASGWGVEVTAAPEPEAQTDGPPALNRMTKAELMTCAGRMDVPVNDRHTKAEMIERILKAGEYV